MSVIEEVLFSTVRIETESPEGKGYGTGFLYQIPLESAPEGFEGDDFPSALVIVSNKHVIKGVVKGRFRFTKSNGKKQNEGEAPLIGEVVEVELDNFEAQWHGHPDPDIDIAVLPVGEIVRNLQTEGNKPFFRAIPHSMVPSRETLKRMDVLEEIIFVGYPNGLIDPKHFMPILRRGITATPIHMNFGGQYQFLIDASTFEGSSGSPVFIMRRHSNFPSGEPAPVDLWFVGVVAAAYLRFNKLEAGTLTPPGLGTTERLDLGIVFQSPLIQETITHLFHGRTHI